MITIGYSTRFSNPKFKEYLRKSCVSKNVQIIEKVTNGEKNLSEVYNEIISESINNIVILCHDDIKIDSGWDKKILKDFQDNPDYGIIGKAGSCYFSESGIYWEKMHETMAGQVYHQPENKKKGLSRYSGKLPFLVPVVTIDGLFMSFKKDMIKHKFDETIGGFHFYDHSFCLPNYVDGVKIGVTSSFEIIHQSVGTPNDEFYKTKDIFLKKYGHHLPLDLKPTDVYVPVLHMKPLKNVGKVATIILTKGKLDLLFQCVTSFITYCDKKMYEIFIADTGSTEIEKEQIRTFIKQNESFVTIHLIEYDYFNFGKINNDVVRNHIDSSFEYILFCNNDIKLLSNVIHGMLNIFKDQPKAGTVGCRLHFGDHTVQHDGMLGVLNKENQFRLTHHGFKSYYMFSPYVKKVFGNTGALLMIRKNTFENCEYFNETYISCFEDVELNMKCFLLGYENYNDGGLVAYHYESQSRNDNPDTTNNMKIDYENNLIPFINKNFERIKPRLLIIQYDRKN